jgi:hypothetical protein
MSIYMPNNKNPKRQEEENNNTQSATSSSDAPTRAEGNESTFIAPTTTPTTQRIDRTFDEAKANTRRAIEEAERELPRYMQIVTTNRAISRSCERNHRELS